MAHTIDDDAKKIVRAIIHGEKQRQSRKKKENKQHLTDGQKKR